MRAKQFGRPQGPHNALLLGNFNGAERLSWPTLQRDFRDFFGGPMKANIGFVATIFVYAGQISPFAMADCPTRQDVDALIDRIDLIAQPSVSSCDDAKNLGSQIRVELRLLAGGTM